MEAEREFSDYANALLSLRMAASLNQANGYSSEEPGDNLVSDDDRYEAAKQKVTVGGFNITPFSSWSSQDLRGMYGLNESTAKQNKKRVHVQISATSSESNDSYDNDNGVREAPEKRLAPRATSTNPEKTGGKLQRGRYRCSLCGAFKTNHVCALVADKLMCSVGTQSYSNTSLLSLMPQSHGAGDQCVSAVDALAGAASLVEMGLDASSPQQMQLLANSRLVPAHPDGSLLGMDNATGALGSFAASCNGSNSSSSSSSGGPKPVAHDLPGKFQQRIVTVSRNRKTIQHPLPTTLSSASTEEGYSTSGGGGGVMVSTSDEHTGDETSLHTSPVAAAHQYQQHQQHQHQQRQPALSGSSTTLSALLSGHHLLGAPLAPLQPPSLPPLVHLWPSQMAPYPQTPKAPSLIYPSALDLLGQAIYE